MDLKVHYKQTSDCQLKLDIEIPYETLHSEYEELKAQMSKEVSLPGFRKGKVPLDLIEKKFKHSIQAKVLKKTIPNAYQKAIEQENLEPFGQPIAEDISTYEPDQPLKVRISVDRRPSCSLNYKKRIELSCDTCVVEDIDVDHELKRMFLREKATYTKGEVVRAKDTLVTFTVHVLDEKVGRRSFKDQVMIMDSDICVDTLDLRTELLDMKIHEPKKLRKTFPNSFIERDLSGKTFDIELEVTTIQYSSAYELAAAVEIGKELGHDSEKALRQATKEKLHTWATERLHDQLREQALWKMIEQTTFEIPRSAVKMLAEDAITQIYSQYQQTESWLEEVLRQQGTNLKELQKYYEEMAETNLKKELLLTQITKDGNIQVTENELNEHVERIATSQKKPTHECRKKLIKSGEYTQLKNNIKRNKALDFLLKKVIVKKGKQRSLDEVSKHSVH